MRAIVFDCDGVLVDTESLAGRAWSSLTERYGYTVTAQDIAASIGRTEEHTYEHLAGRVPLPPWAESITAVDEVRWQLFEDEMEAFPDAVETVRNLAMEGIPLAVASSSRIAEVRWKLDRVDLTRFFDVLVGGDEVPDGKPAPDVYLLAAERIGLDPQSCLAIEDAPVGVTAATTAGMRVVAVNREGRMIEGAATVSSLEAESLKLWL